MGDETLLDKAVLDLKIAQLILQSLDDGDERILNSVGYKLQQSAELTLKHYLETESTGFPFTHDIEILIDLVDNAGCSLKMPDKFRFIAGTLTSWESKTRCVKNYVASRNSVLNAMDAMQELFTENDIEYTKIDTTKYRVFRMNPFETSD